MKKQQPVLRGTEQTTGHVETIHKKITRGQKAVKAKTDTQSSGCSRCGQVRKYLWKDYPAREAECRKCHEKGHFAKKFRSTGGVHDISAAQIESQEEEDFAFLGEMCLSSVACHRCWRAAMGLCVMLTT